MDPALDRHSSGSKVRPAPGFSVKDPTRENLYVLRYRSFCFFCHSSEESFRGTPRLSMRFSI